jgi:hypothetical protein
MTLQGVQLCQIWACNSRFPNVFHVRIGQKKVCFWHTPHIQHPLHTLHTQHMLHTQHTLHPPPGWLMRCGLVVF